MTLVPWYAWRPDVAGPDKPFAVTASGVLPQAGPSSVGYGPFPSLETATGAEALSAAPRGIVSVQKFDGSWEVYAATATTIEKLSATYQWSDVETGRTVTSGDDVSFLHFGAYLLNTDTTSGLCAYNIETPGTNDAVSGAPGNVRALCSCSNVVFAFDCDGNNRRMESSARGDHTNWTTQGADGKTFEDGGALLGGRDLKNGNAIVFQERALRLIQFGQGPGLYSISKIADGRGAVADRTIVAFDGTAFWFDSDGPWQYTVGGAPSPIGAEKVNRWLEANVGSSNFQYLQGAIDPARNIVMWRVNSSLILAYNWLIKEFSLIPAITSTLSRIATAGVTINDLSGTIDSQTLTINNRQWQGGVPVLGALDASYKFATFSGASMAALLESGLRTDDSEPLIKWAKPSSDASGSLLAVGTSPSLSASTTYGANVAKGSHGWTQQRARSRLFAFRETIPAGQSWTFANGVEIGGGPKQ